MATVVLTVGTLQDSRRMDTVVSEGGEYYEVGLDETLSNGIQSGDILLQTSGGHANDYWRVTAIYSSTRVQVHDEWALGYGPDELADADIGRMFTSLGAAEAAIGTFCSAGDTCRIEMYADGAIEEASVTFDDATLGTGGRLEVVATTGQEHRGWPHGGVVWKPTAAGGNLMLFDFAAETDPSKLIQGFEIDRDHLQSTGTTRLLNVTTGGSAACQVNRLVIHGVRKTETEETTMIRMGPAGAAVENCLLYDSDATGVAGIRMTGAGVESRNNTLCDLSGGTAIMSNDETTVARGNAVFGCAEAFAGAMAASSGWNATDAASAPGSNNLLNLTAADEFVDAANHDYRLRGTSNLRRSGVNNITTDRLDVTARARHYPFDIGAYQHRRAREYA